VADMPGLPNKACLPGWADIHKVERLNNWIRLKGREKPHEKTPSSTNDN